MVSAAGEVRVHVVPWTDEPWDVESSLLSLVVQEGVRVSIHLHPRDPVDAATRARWERLVALGAGVTLEVGERRDGPWPSAEAVAVWVAGTVATPDHLSRALAELRSSPRPLVAPVRRVRRRAVPGGPPYVLAKSRRAEPPVVTLEELAEDPAFLGRCVFQAEAAPGWIPDTAEEQRRWAVLAWGSLGAARLVEPPLVDIPDLRERPVTRWRDLRAELDYQVPRWLERRIPVTFAHGNRWVLRLRRLPGKLRGLFRGAPRR